MIWTPLHLVDDIRGVVAAEGLVGALTSLTVLQVAFNVLLFVPWGVIVRGFLHRSVATATLSGWLASVLVEATQATGLWFVYPCAYRVADVDDVLTNTLGALIGALVAPVLVWWMPRSRALAAGRLRPRPVTVWRRWTGMAVDAFAVWALSTAPASRPAPGCWPRCCRTGRASWPSSWPRCGSSPRWRSCPSPRAAAA